MNELRVRVGDRVDAMVASLAAELNQPRIDPFESDVVAVTSPGQGRWLMQQLGLVLGTSEDRCDGVCARIEMPTPRALLAELEAEVLGISTQDDPWGRDRLTWTMLRAFEIAENEPWFHDVAIHISNPERPGRRYATARLLGAMFSRYARWRPDLLTTPGSGSHAWQSPLWALMVDLVGGPVPWERSAEAAERLCGDVSLSRLPARVSLWAPQRLSPSERSLLEALGAGREVTVWWPVASVRDDHLLVQRLGGASRAALGALTRHVPAELSQSRPATSSTLLSRLQEQIKIGAVGPVGLEPDSSIRIHLSHGLDRQIEVLRDVLCDLFETHPDLEPRDVVVCTPQLDAVAPLVHALCMLGTDALGPGAHPVSGLRMRVVDPSAARTNQILDVLMRLLDLATSRAELTDLLALCGSAPVARKFRLDAERLETLGELLERSGVRWGLDPSWRTAFGLEGINQNTLLAGLNRLVLGVALSERDLAYTSSVLPLDMVESGDLDLVGAISEIYSVVKQALGTFSEPATPYEWVNRFGDLLNRLIDVSSDDAWQLGYTHVLLSDFAQEAGVDAPKMGLGDIKHLVADWLSSNPPRSTLLTGTLTVTTLEALRQIPHRVVCLIGIDEAVFPRSSHRMGDDLLELAADPEVPQSSRDDRQLFLDALMAAKDAFVIVGAGRDQRTNELLPLPAPVIDLFEALKGLGVEKDSVIVEHALQPYELGAEPSYDTCAVEARRALLAPKRTTRDRFGTQTIAPVDRPTVVTLAELTAFLKHPAREFLKRRVGSWYGITRSEVETDTDVGLRAAPTEIPIRLDPLGNWDLETRLLRLAVEGHAPDSIIEAERRRGQLPPKARGQDALGKATTRVGEVLDNLRPYLARPLDHLDLAVDLPGGVRVTGRVPVRGDVVVEATTSKPSDKRLIEPWLRLLLLSASTQTEWSSVVCSSSRVVRLSHMSREEATSQLDRLVSLMLDGWDQPLPLPPRVCFELADPYGLADEERLRRVWGFDVDPTWLLFFDDLSALDQAAKPRGGLRKLAQDTYGPLLDALR